MAAVNYYLDIRRKKKDGTFPVKIRVSHIKTFLITTKFSAKVENWCDNSFTKKELNYQAKNSSLHRLFNKIECIIVELRNSGKLYNMSDSLLKKYIEEEISDSPRSEKTFIMYVEEFIKSTDKKENTQKLYLRTIDYIEEFDSKCVFETMTRKWLESFENYLRERGKKTNTISIHLRNIRSVFNYAIDNDYTSFYPFRKYNIKTEETRKRSLTVEQLIRLKNFTCEEYQEKYIDIFMLMFYLIGINPIDLLNCKRIINGRIEYKREKTGKLYSIKVEPEAMEIINKYKGQKYLLNMLDGNEDYVCFNTNMNKGLKKIGDFVKGDKGKKIKKAIEPELSSYWARHTWATIAHKIGIPKDVISLALGHSFGAKVTDVYINYDNSKIDKANRRVIDFINGKSKKTPIGKENPYR